MYKPGTLIKMLLCNVCIGYAVVIDEHYMYRFRSKTLYPIQIDIVVKMCGFKHEEVK